MIFAQVLEAVDQLPRQEQEALLDHLRHSLDTGQGARKLVDTSLDRVRGLLRSDGPAPSDEQVQEMIEEYLMEKHR